LFDPHSRNNSGQITENGSSVLLKFNALQSVENYIKDIHVSPGQEMYLETQYFRIITTDQITGKIKLSIGKKRKLDANRKYCNSKKGQEKRRESKKVYRKTERGKAMAKKSTAKYKKTEQGRANAKKKATAKYKNASNFPKTINEFKKRIKDGPFYICVICDRSLYKRSLKIFYQTDYAD